MAAVTLKLHGSNAPFSLRRPKPSTIRAKTFLDKAPKDEIFTAEQLSEKSGIALSGVRSAIASQPELDGYSLKVGAVRYWGNRAAIKALRSQVER